METESDFDAKVRKGGNSYIITIPIETIEKLDLAINFGLTVHIKKWAK